MKTTNLRMLVLIPLLLAGLGLACTNQRSNDASYKDAVQNALKQSELTDVTVSEDRDRNTITLGGTVHSEDAKRNADDVAKAAAGTRVVANEVSVQPVGTESQAKDVASNLDDAIEKDYKAALISKGLTSNTFASTPKRHSCTERQRQVHRRTSAGSVVGASCAERATGTQPDRRKTIAVVPSRGPLRLPGELNETRNTIANRVIFIALYCAYGSFAGRRAPALSRRHAGSFGLRVNRVVSLAGASSVARARCEPGDLRINGASHTGFSGATGDVHTKHCRHHRKARREVRAQGRGQYGYHSTTRTGPSSIRISKPKWLAD